MLVGKKFGPFTVEDELGSGAMGTVYLAKMERKGKLIPVALKMVSMALLGDEKTIARFEREANILKQLRHPHIVRLYGTGKFNKTPFIVMEYVEGESLDHVLARRGRMSCEEALALGLNLCEALQHAHEKGIIHRDLKPANLILAKGTFLKLTDFGIAKDTDVTALTGANSTLGTASYMSPEQCRGERNITNRSDLYSLGVVFYELITGKKPFYAENSMEMFLKHVNEVPLRPTRYIPDLPVWVDNLIMFLLEKKPESRPVDAATVGKMIADIQQKVQDQQSAGVEAASARRVDRKLHEGATTDADRDAALVLRGKSKKRKKKELEKKAEKKKAWLAIGGIAGIVLLLGGLAYLQFRPDSLPKAYAKVEAAPADDKLDAAAEFLKKYAGKTGPEMDKANALFREKVVAEGERQLVKRYNNKLIKPQEGEDKEAIDNVWLAMDAEGAGNLKRATDSWKVVSEKSPPPSVEKFSSKPDACRVGLQWIAAKRQADLDSVPAKQVELANLAENSKFNETTPSYPKTSPDDLAFRAVWLERFGDITKAKKLWELLASQSEKDLDMNRWLLLANANKTRLSAAPNEDLPKRIARVDAALKAADAKWEEMDDTQGRKAKLAARTMWFEITAIYDDETDPALKSLGATAKQRLNERKKPE
jgi:serine/threonine-protein kinase